MTAANGSLVGSDTVTPTDVHLVVLIHGLWGRPEHLDAAKTELEAAWRENHAASLGARTAKSFTDDDSDQEDPVVETRVSDEHSELVIMIAGGMTHKLTYDGIDVCASRVAWEVDQEIAELKTRGKTVTKFSVTLQTGYSLGGLVARYLVGLLHARTPSFFSRHRPVAFATVATPHLGIPRYNTFLSTVLCWMGGRLMSRSGEQLYVVDRYSEEDPRPLLEIMADPKLVFVQALSRFTSIEIFVNAVKDDTVPYPSAAIEAVDHFAQWTEQGLQVEVNEYSLVQSWSAPKVSDTPMDSQGKNKAKRGTWGSSMGTLPPVLRFKFPLNYIILLLSPIMIPLVVLLMVARLSLDTNSSRQRLQRLARTSSLDDLASLEHDSPTPIPSAGGLSIEGLRMLIRRVERNIEQPIILSADSDDIELPDVVAAEPQAATVKVRLTDGQLRMVYWLNKLPIKKYIAWYPEVTNSHAVIVVRNPAEFAAHEKGRGVLKQWAKGIVNAV